MTAPRKLPPAVGLAGSQTDPRRWIALAVVLLASFMILLDISIVNVAIPSIRDDLRASFAQIEFVLAGYQLAYAVVLITGGRLGDIFGRKRLFIIGVSGFTLASALCGFAPSANVLVGSRVLQGLMAGLMYPQVLSVIQVSFPPHERGAAFGIFGGVIGVATISGPILGGIFLKLDVLGQHWRPIFLVNIPVGVAAVLAAGLLLHESRSPRAPRLDLPGVLLASLALFLLSFPLVEGRDAGWPPWIYFSLAAAIVLFVIFAVYERWRATHRGHPLVEPALFRNRAFVVGTVLAAAFFSGIPAFFLTFSLFLQVGLGFDPLHAGLTTVPFAVGSALASGASVRLAPRVGKAILSLGCGLLIAGMAGLYLTMRITGTGFSSWQLLPALSLCGLGLGCVVAPLINIILAGIHRADAGSASGVLTTVQQVGGALGVALVGIIYFGALASHADVVSADRGKALQSQLLAAHVPPVTAERITAGLAVCFHDRSNATDPLAVPPSCATPRTTTPEVVAIVAGEAVQRNRTNFLYAFDGALLYDIATFAIVFFLVFLLPASQSVRAPTAGAMEPGPEAAGHDPTPIRHPAPAPLQVPAPIPPLPVTAAAEPAAPVRMSSPTLAAASPAQLSQSSPAAASSLRLAFTPPEPAPIRTALGASRIPPAELIYPLPKGRGVYERLKSNFVDLSRLLLTLEADHHTGYLRLAGHGFSGYMLIDQGQVLDIVARTTTWFGHGDRALLRFHAAMDDPGGHLDVIELRAATVTTLHQCLEAPAMYTGLLGRFINFGGLVAYLAEVHLDGSVIVIGSSEIGVILLRDGEVFGCYTQSQPELRLSDESVARLAAERTSQIEVKGGESRSGFVDDHTLASSS